MSLHLPDEAAYREHFVRRYTKMPVMFTHQTGKAPIYFKSNQFDHAFYESTRRDGAKDQFSLTRARRMDDIALALGNPALERRAGWDSKNKRHDHIRCVTVAVGDFVVIIRLGLTSQGHLRGNFVTCYVADNSIGKIRRAPTWNQAFCLAELTR